MVSTALRNATRLVRKQSIPESDRTPERDKAADWIDEHAADDWEDWNFTDIEDETDWSRQHIANTVEKFFEPADAMHQSSQGSSVPADVRQSQPVDLGQEQLPQWVLDAVKEAYRDGYRDGIQDAQPGGS